MTSPFSMRFLIAALLLLVAAARSFGGDVQQPRRLRRPVALQLSGDEHHLYTANRDSGTISVVDWRARTVVDELAVGTRLSDLAGTRDGQHLLAIDESEHELVVVGVDSHTLRVEQRVPVAPFPVKLCVAEHGNQCVIASLWSHRLTFVQLPSPAVPKAVVRGSLDLPFAPRCQLSVRQDSRLIVADAFGGHLAIVDPRKMTLLDVRSIPAHNIRGLGLTDGGQGLVVAQQLLNSLAHTIRNDVHWGLVVSNDLRHLKLRNVLEPESNLFDGAHMQPLGQPGNATGDPADLLITADDTVVVSLGGVGEISYGDHDAYGLQRMNVGRRPTGLAASRDGRYIFVANTFDDSLSVVDLIQDRHLDEIALGPQPALTTARRGELLFYDAHFSHDRWMSCHSCHTDGHTNGLLSDNLSDGSYGAPKRVLSLLGRRGTEPFAWTGSSADLPTQIRKSIVHTMQADEPPSDAQLTDLAAFVASLPPPPSRDALRGTLDEVAVSSGRQVFDEFDCSACHEPPFYTSADNYDVGLEDERGQRHFNPPSLLGVAQRAPYFHDNRARSLHEVLHQVRHQVPEDAPNGKLRDLLVFLQSL